MSKPTTNNPVITQYLLGALPDAEAERLDELSVTDDEFADTLRAAEKDLIDAYVQGELTGAELARFESYYLASPLRRERVKFAQAFHSSATEEKAARDAAGASKDAAAVTGRKISGRFSSRRVFAAPRLAWRWGAAFAALVLVCVGVWLAFENARLRRQMAQAEAVRDERGQREQELQRELEAQRTAQAQTEQELARTRAEHERLERELQEAQQRAADQQRAPGQEQAASTGAGTIASFILSPQLRGEGQSATVNISADTDSVVMRLSLEPDEHTAYRVALLDAAGNQTLWRSGRLRARAGEGGKMVSVTLRAALLKPQTRYVLRVLGVAGGGAAETVGDYPFRVVR